MIGFFKRLFGKKADEVPEEDKPGRTFKRILTTEHFGLQDPEADPDAIQAAKEDKREKITSLSLSPKFVRYALKKRGDTQEVTAAHVVFQKEEYDQKWHMVHVTEVSFVVPKDEFSEFETMLQVSLKEDFRDLTAYDGAKPYEGKERRKQARPSVFDA